MYLILNYGTSSLIVAEMQMFDATGLTLNLPFFIVNFIFSPFLLLNLIRNDRIHRT